MATNQIPHGAVPPKKTSPVVWIILALAVFLMLGVAALLVGGYFAFRAARNVASNPATAIAKIVGAANPDVELVSVDEARNVVILKDKKTGKTFTLNFNDVRSGRIVMEDEGKGSVTIGSGGKIPDWIGTYPGSNPEATFAVQGDEGNSGSFRFNTKDGPEQVLKFYSDEFGKAGLKTTSNVTSEGGKTSGGMVMAEDEGSKRSAMVTVAAEDGGTSVSVTFTQKK